MANSSRNLKNNTKQNKATHHISKGTHSSRQQSLKIIKSASFKIIRRHTFKPHSCVDRDGAGGKSRMTASVHSTMPSVVKTWLPRESNASKVFACKMRESLNLLVVSKIHGSEHTAMHLTRACIDGRQRWYAGCWLGMLMMSRHSWRCCMVNRLGKNTEHGYAHLEECARRSFRRLE